ncbi:MAG: hypothetical protein GYA57_18630 [Myxococcales bacterium]|nr:hypothetical protein [Myxococcales bacterium]
MNGRRTAARRGAAALAALALAGCGLETAGLGAFDAPGDGSVATDGEARSEAEADAPHDEARLEANPPDAPDTTGDADPRWCGDGIRQPGEPCEPGDVEACESACGPGVRTCSPICTWDTCRSSAVESCNGLDDDCSGRADDGAGMECVAGMEEPCGACHRGTRVCDRTTCTWGACAMPAGDACEPGTTQPCTPLVCGPGHRTCLPDCRWGECEPDVNECSPGTTRICDGPDWCGQGVQTCGGDCRWSPCDGSPPWDCDSMWDSQGCERYPGCWGFRSCDRGCHWSPECHRLYC